MSLKCGIVGLPNVGKSTLFNALTSSNIAQAANYPFCTIEPNTAIVNVPDERLQKLADIAGSKSIIHTYMEFVDIAGLVKGASKGEGLGNKFLSHIREVDAIIHVLRCFEDPNITHVHGTINPVHDAEVIETELIIADLESVEKRLNNIGKRLQSGDKAVKAQFQLLEQLKEHLSKGKPVRDLIGVYEARELNNLQLLTAKPVLYICNVLENEAATGNHLSAEVNKMALANRAQSIVISSKIESEISTLGSLDEKTEFLKSLCITESGLDKIIKASYVLLDLQSFFTIGPKEAHAWTFEIGTLAPAAAGIIHTDFEKGFIRAEVISYDNFISLGGEAKAKEAGKMRLEGKDYKMQDGDVVHFRFNV